MSIISHVIMVDHCFSAVPSCLLHTFPFTTSHQKVIFSIFNWRTRHIFVTMHTINLLSLAISVCATSSNIQKFFILLTQFVYTFCMYLATNSEFRPTRHPMACSYNRVRKCLQRGTNWGFKYNSLRFVLTGLIQICFFLLKYVWKPLFFKSQNISLKEEQNLLLN